MAMGTLSFGSQSIITGGTFTQVNNNIQGRPHTPWDRLQASVAPAAFHNSPERFDPPRCHPNTRVAVMNELRNLALRWDNAGNARILWLNGSAGVGKSAIAQSFCEECCSADLLLASFFFNRSEPSRNNAKSFVATLTYQIYGKVPAYYQSLILGAIEKDPLVFERSVDAQFRALIMEPLQDLFGARYFGVPGAASLIVIDGLDECSGAPVRVSILNALERVSTQLHSPFVFIVSSRPEHDIQMFMRSSGLGIFLYRLNLDDSYRPDVDIELYVKEKMREILATHPLKDSISQEWPSPEAIQTLVWKSSGQFIYAAVVIKYVTSSHHYPPNRLDVVLGLRPTKRGLPFAELDALYSHIFASVEDIALVQRILLIILLDDSYLGFSIEDIEQLCELDQGDCLDALCNLQSVLQVTTHGQQFIHFRHKSLADYPQDTARSHDNYINTDSTAVIFVMTQCLRCISEFGCNAQLSYFTLLHLNLLLGNIQLCHKSLVSFSLMSCWKTDHASELKAGQEGCRMGFLRFLTFAFGFLDRLCTLEGTEYEHIYFHHLYQFPKLVDKYPSEVDEATSGSPAYRHWILPMMVVFTVLGDFDPDFLVKAIHLQQRLFEADPQTDEDWLNECPNLSCAAAQCCLKFLRHDSRPKLAAFALKCLSLILPGSRLSPVLNKACLPGEPFACAATGDHRISQLAHSAYITMQNYRERYAEVISDTE